MKRIRVDIDENLYYDMKKYVLIKNTTIKEFISMLIKHEMEKNSDYKI